MTTLNFQVLELWPGVYLQAIADEFEWITTNLMTTNTGSVDMESLIVTNDVYQAREILKNLNNPEWIKTILEIFPKAKLMTVQTLISEVRQEGSI